MSARGTGKPQRPEGSSGSDEEPVVVEERAHGYGWARRTVFGGGGWSGAAWRGLASPLGWGWRTVARRRLAPRRPGHVARRLPAPAVAVGNVIAGGGGKTSLILWLLAEGLPDGAVAAVLTRGVGRSGRGVLVLPPRAPLDRAARAGGDEPSLLARAGTWVGVGADRARAASALLNHVRPDLFLLDDALQHRRVARALDLVAFTAGDLAAPARCLPAGPLRQDPTWVPPHGAWIVAGVDPREERWPRGSIGAAFGRWWEELPGSQARWVDAGTISLGSWQARAAEPFDPGGRPVVAFAGVARPASVARFANLGGLPVARVVAFRDHYFYRRADVASLLTDHPRAAFVTTEKDATKCDPSWFEDRPVGVLRRRLEPADPGLLRDLIRVAIAWPR